MGRTLVWQLTEVAYFLGIWGYFVYLYRAPTDGGYTGISPGWYFVILAARLLSLALLASTVVARHPSARTRSCPCVRHQR